MATMDLSIDFECPECRKVHSKKLADLSPGRRQACLACGTPTELTVSGLKELKHRLRESVGAEQVENPNPG
ncbi:MAG TPA: hypothetical protein VIA07_02405, partial [Desulfuromonadales bacterium]